MSVTLTSRHKNDLDIKKIFKKKIIIIYDNLCKTPQSDRAKSRVRNSPIRVYQLNKYIYNSSKKRCCEYACCYILN